MIFPMPNPPIRRPKPVPFDPRDWRAFYNDPLVSDEERAGK